MDTIQIYIQPSSAEPIYRQIVEQIKRFIAAGQIMPGELLPSVREVAATHAINPMTVSRAYSQLEAEGLLERLRGKGMAVAGNVKIEDSRELRVSNLDPLLMELIRQARELDVPIETVIERLKTLQRDNQDV